MAASWVKNDSIGSLDAGLIFNKSHSKFLKFP